MNMIFDKTSVSGVHKDKTTFIIFTFVLMIHVIIGVWLITRQDNYNPLDLLKSSEAITIQANMVPRTVDSEPQQIQEPEAIIRTPLEKVVTPNVLTSLDSEREIALNEKAIVRPRPQANSVVPASSVPVSKQIQPKLKTEQSRQLKADRAPATVATIPHSTTDSASTTSAVTANAPHSLEGTDAEPKQVSSVGCTVPEPDYPRQAKRLELEGDVVLSLVINQKGELIQHHIIRSSGYSVLDRAAIEAIEKTHCTPYLVNGRAITVMTLQSVSFRLS